LYIDDLDDNSTDIQAFLRTIDDSTSTIKGHFRISNKFDSSDFALFTISSLTENTGYFTVSCAYVSGSAASFSGNEDVIITFARTGDVGDTGAQGVQGAVGAQGAQGVQGSQGVQGEQGFQGTQGEQGYQGFQGEQGVQGSQGHQGVVGAQGEQGIQGATGAQGEQGVQGSQGVQGAVGAQGATGDKNGLRYSFSTTVTMVDPGTGFVRYNNATIGSVNKVAISDLDVTSADFSSYLLSFDNSTSVVKGYLIIQSNNLNDATSTIFEVTGLTDNSGWVEYDVVYVSGTRPSSNEGLVVSFSRTGDLGEQGFQGVQGAVGAQGAQGVQGAQGAVGAQGAQGVQGDVGAQGSQGVQGAQGVQGDVGAQGSQGVQGAQGVQGDVGAQGSQGVQGAQGVQGEQGYQGVKGEKGELETGSVVFTSGATAPVSPTEGDEWLDTDTGILFKFFDDGSSAQWVEFGAAGSGSGGAGSNDEITVTRSSFVANGSQSNFTLSTAPYDEDHTLVFVDLVFQRNSSYNVSSTTLSFAAAPAANSVIDAYTISGTAGPQGVQGPQGTQGPAGTGAQGAQGPQGTQGPAGAGADVIHPFLLMGV
jgi:hypothetical protein